MLKKVLYKNGTWLNFCCYRAEEIIKNICKCLWISDSIKKNFSWMGFNCLKVTVTSRRQCAFYHSVPRNSWYSFYRPQTDERLSWPWSHPVVFNTGPLDWESSALTTRYWLIIFGESFVIFYREKLWIWFLSRYFSCYWCFIIFKILAGPPHALAHWGDKIFQKGAISRSFEAT